VGKWEPREVKRERPNQRNGQRVEDKAVRSPGLPLLAHREAVSFKRLHLSGNDTLNPLNIASKKLMAVSLPAPPISSVAPKR